MFHNTVYVQKCVCALKLVYHLLSIGICGTFLMCNSGFQGLMALFVEAVSAHISVNHLLSLFMLKMSQQGLPKR